jgi:hypothetical protein
LPRFLSDHNPLILCGTMFTHPITKPLRFEKTWLNLPGFLELLEKWWQEFHIRGDFGNDWRLKLQYIRKKLRG